MIIGAINFDSDKYVFDTPNENNMFSELKFADNYITPLRKLNIFIGANSSGKSQFLRHLISQKNNVLNNVIIELFSAMEHSDSQYEQAHFFKQDFIDYLNNPDINNNPRLIALHDSYRKSGLYGLNVTSHLGLTADSNIIDSDFFFVYIPILRGLRQLDFPVR